LDEDEDIPAIDQASLVQYILAALDMDGVSVDPEFVERILDLELEYLQHKGIAEQALEDPRPE
jgi:hypothetical protein